jgi:hypothetical protein
MTLGQKKLLLEMLANGNMRFERVGADRQLVEEAGKNDVGGGDVRSSQKNVDISWAYEEDKQSEASTTVGVCSTLRVKP